MSKVFASYEEVLAASERFATGLGHLVLPRGSRVLVGMEQRWESVAFVWACLGTGLVPVPVSAHLKEYELTSIREDIDPAFEVPGWAEMQQLLASTRSTFERTPPCRPIHLTSGTTGRPKGVWSGFWSAEHASAALKEESELWGFTAADTNLVISPLYHSAPLRFALNTVIAGGGLVVPDRFDMDLIRAAIDSSRPTTVFCVPTHLKRFITAHDAGTGIDFSSFRLIVHAGAPCPPEVKMRAIDLIGIDTLCEFYGSTEGQFTVASSRDWLEHGAGVGYPRANRTMFTDAERQLWCVVPPWSVFSYFGDEARTREAWIETENGPAFTLGDLGRVDPDGWVHIDARRTDLIISGGVNLYPREIELVIETFPGVDECAVVGRPHEEWGQEAVAVIVGKPDVNALREQLQQSLSRTKIPKDFILVEQIPHTATGKIQRHRLLEQI